MAKFCGMIGYGEMVDRGLNWPWDPFNFDRDNASQVDTGIHEEAIVERKSVGDILQNQHRWQSREELHDDLVVSNRISIVADAYARDHFFNIRYVTWRGVRWKVSHVEVQHPRLILTLGEVYHGPEAGSPADPPSVHGGSGL